MPDTPLPPLTPFQLAWLRACAVYPVLRWPLTVHLGREMAKLQGRAEPDLDSHVELARLPWFREGFIPDEVRRDLVEEMPESERETVREIIEGHLTTLDKGKRVSKSDIIADEVFTRFMMQEEQQPRERAVDAAIQQGYGLNSLLRVDVRSILVVFWAVLAGLALGGGALAVTSGWTAQSAQPARIPIPQMVELPGGSFQMGSPEIGLGESDDEGPVREVEIAPFQIARTEVTRAQYAAFIRESGYQPESGCFVWDETAQGYRNNPNGRWDNPSFAQGTSHPVVCVSWNDAQAYIDWLNSLVENGGYRLPSEAEWEYAARGRSQTRFYWWGVDGLSAETTDQCGYSNGADRAARESGLFPESWTFAECEDGSIYTSPVQSFLPNAFSLHDMSGNALEWVEDCWHETYDGAPLDGRAWLSSEEGDCDQRILRGGSWDNYPGNLRSADRVRVVPDYRNNGVGFRLARTLTP